MKKLFWLIVIAVIFIAYIHPDWIMVPPVGAMSCEKPCILPPTGCPYADQIPVDSPKCRAPEDPPVDNRVLPFVPNWNLAK